MGAIAWNLATWYFGLPSSSSHALIGGLIGSTVAATGTGAVDGNGVLAKVMIPALIAPILAFAVAGLAILVIYRIVGRVRPGPVTRGFKLGQLASAACSRCRTARTTRRRRWASSRSPSSPTATSRPTTSTCRPGW